MTAGEGGRVPRYGLWLLGLAAVALAIRMPGVFGQGWPFCFYDDETANIARALRFGALGSLDPQWYNKPTLGYYLWFLLFGGYFAIGRVAGWWSDPREFGILYFEDISPFLGIGRVSAVLFGVATVLVTARLGRRLSGRQDVGLASAMALTVMTAHVGSSQQVKLDVMAAFFTTWMALGMVEVLNRGRQRDYFWTGFAGGLGMATKYYAAPLLAGMLFVHCFRPRPERPGRRIYWLAPVGFGFFAFLLGFFAGSPYCFLSRKWWNDWFLPQFRFIFDRVDLGFLQAAGEGVRVPSLVEPERHPVFLSMKVLLYRLTTEQGIGPVLSVAAVAGFLALLWQRKARTVFAPLLCLLCIYVFSLASRQFPELRHLNSLYPLIAVIIAFGLLPLLDPLVRSIRIRLALLSLLFLAPIPGLPMAASINLNRERLQSDPRVPAYDWICENLPAGATVISDHDSIPIRASRERCEWAIATSIREAKLLRERAARAERGEIGQSASHLKGLASHYDDKRVEWEMRLKAAVRFPEGRFDTLPFEHDWYAEKLIMRRHAAAGFNPIPCRSPWGHYMVDIIIEAEADGLGLPAERAERRFIEMLIRDYREEARREVLRIAAGKGEIPDEEAVEREAGAMIGRIVETFDLKPGGSPALVELWRRPTPVSRPWLARSQREGGGTAYKTPEFLVTVESLYDRFDTPHKRANFPDWHAFYNDLRAHYRAVEFGTGSRDLRQVVRIYDLRERLGPGSHVLRIP